MPRPGVLRRCRRLAAPLVVVAALALSACSVPMDESAPPSLPDDVTAVLVQLRSDVAARQAQVEVRNGTDEPIEIGGVTVTDPRFADVATRVLDRVTTIPAGHTVDIRIQLPKMACEATDGASTVQLTFLERGFDDLREGPLPDKLDALPPIHEKECRAQALAEAAAVSIASFTASQPGAPADLTLQVSPTGEAAAQIVDIQSTNLLTYVDHGGTAFPLDIAITADDTTATTVHLPLVPFRCDPHAVQEDKRGTVFNLDVELDGEPGVVQVAATEDMRGRILTWVANWCGFGPG